MWYLGYYRGLRKRGFDFNRPLSIGSRVHDALAAYYDPAQRLDPLAHLDRTVTADLEAHPAFETDIRKEADLCRAMLEGYVQWVQETGADEGFRLIAAEGAREVPLFPDDPQLAHVTLLSKLDARVLREVDGARLALEHKTVADLSTPLPILQLDTQLLTEQLVEHMALAREDTEALAAKGCVYNMLRKVKRGPRAKPPFYGRETVTHNVAELRNHWKHVVGTAREIVTAEKLLADGADHHVVCPPNVTRDSKWDNEFLPIYLLLDDGSDPEPAIADLYEVGNPLERYSGLSAAEINAVGVGLPA